MPLFRVIDTETTGFPPNASMVEFGFTDVITSFVPSERPRVIGPQSTLLEPKHEISTGARAVHHITDEELANAPKPEIALSKIHEGVDYWVAHNKVFDQQLFKPAGGAPWICTLKVSRHYIEDATSHSNQFLRYHLGIQLPDPKKADPPHRAGPDTYVTAYILLALMGPNPTQEQINKMVELSGQPSLLKGEIKFGKHKGTPWEKIPLSYLRWILEQPTGEEDVKFTAKHWYDHHTKTRPLPQQGLIGG